MKPLTPFAAQWSAISALLDEALNLPAPERETWLAGLAGEQATHREAVRTLLARQAEVETDDFLAVLPTLDRLPAEPGNNPGPGSEVGAYRLTREIGRGGMGSVWLAERADGTVQRQVALKLPRVTWGDTFAERLAREREILASLAHPHIARLYDAGVDTHGRPFLAMEYVQGEPIDGYCRHHALPLRERVALLLQVMAAVAHAHARLVVHRDLKPSNILVTAEGQASLLDFGIAKLLDDGQTQATALTELSGRALTLDYASPEQIRGEPLGTGTDIYSMAVVAYEVLADVRPYRLKRGSAAELEEVIAAAEAPLASSASTDPALRKQLRGDLDAILNHALKKSAAERYPTMEAFAQDFQRWLDGEPVVAQPDRFAYRATKFVGRHRLPVAAGAAVVVALVAGTSVALWQAHEARLQTQRAQAEVATAQAVQVFLEGVFLTNSGDQADPEKARETPARELLDRGAARIDTELQQQPAARLRLLSVLASMYEGMGLVDKQISLRRQQLKAARGLFGPESDGSVTAMAQLADALTLAEQRQEAASLLREADLLLTARGDHASRARFWVELVQASLDRFIDPKHGLAAADRALAIAKSYPPDSALLQTLQIRGENATLSNQYEQARQAFAEKVRISEDNSPLGANDLCETYGSLADALVGLGQFEQAEVMARKGVEIAHRRSEPLRLHNSELQLANILYNTGRFRESLEAAEPAWRWAHSADAAPFPTPRRMIKVNYSGFLLFYGRPQDALVETDEDAALTIEAASASEWDMYVLGVRAIAFTQLGQLGKARALLDQSRSLVEQAPDKVSPFWTNLAERHWLVANGRAGEALAAFRAVEAKHPPASGAAESVVPLTNAAWLTLEAGDAAAAQAQASQALTAVAAGGLAGYQRDFEARATLVLGRALLRQHRAAEALPVLEKAVELHRTVYDPDHGPAVAKAWLALAEARRALGDPRAAAAQEQASRIQTASTTRP